MVWLGFVLTFVASVAGTAPVPPTPAHGAVPDGAVPDTGGSVPDGGGTGGTPPSSPPPPPSGPPPPPPPPTSGATSSPIGGASPPRPPASGVPLPALPSTRDQCPTYSANTQVAVWRCGEAPCPTPTYLPLNAMGQVCDPCTGTVAFEMKVQKGTVAPYTLTFAAVPGLMRSVTCGTCTFVQGVFIELSCNQTTRSEDSSSSGGSDSETKSEGSNSLAPWIIVVIVASAIANVVLLGLGVALLYSRQRGAPSFSPDPTQALASYAHQHHETTYVGTRGEYQADSNAGVDLQELPPMAS